MKAGGGKRKGGAFEREVCKLLSLWISKGKDKDLLWRSAMSGGRSTVAGKKGDVLKMQCGDICAVSPLGHTLTDKFFIECKHVKDLRYDLFLFQRGPLFSFWEVAQREAKRYGKQPMLIARERNTPTMVITQDAIKGTKPLTIVEWAGDWCEITKFDDLLKVKYPYG